MSEIDTLARHRTAILYSVDGRWTLALIVNFDCLLRFHRRRLAWFSPQNAGIRGLLGLFSERPSPPGRERIRATRAVTMSGNANGRESTASINLSTIVTENSLDRLQPSDANRPTCNDRLCRCGFPRDHRNRRGCAGYDTAQFFL